MASLHIPRVLSQRKTSSLDSERENFEKFQGASINKAINSHEAPVKEKHIRTAILGTFHERGANLFWNVVTKMSLQGNPIVCWKFCHTLHKILREGHPHAISDSQKYRSHLGDLSRLWGHLKEGYGKLIMLYCKVLIAKLDFHRKNPRFPGNLLVNNEQLDDIGERDVNAFFQMAVEMLDYMDEILSLQSTVFGSLDMSRSNSMTSSGQCRLAPLIPCIQDSSQLYDFIVKILFKLHSSLPPDILSGHRERFYKQFKILSQFYYNSSNLQYFKYLIQVPSLPDNPPNFFIASDIDQHISPVVILPAQVDTPDTELDILIDTIEPENDQDKFDRVFGNNMGDFSGALSLEIQEKDRLIAQLLKQIQDLKLEFERIKAEDQRTILELRRQLQDLEAQLNESQRLLLKSSEENIQLKADVENVIHNTEAAAKLVEVEKKIKSGEEKFQKMKEVYNKLREEHITLIRNHADVNKQLSGLTKTNEEVLSEKQEIQEKLLRAMSDKTIMEERLQTCASDATVELAQLQITKDELEQKNKKLEEQLEEMVLSKDNLQQQNDSLSQELQHMANELQSMKDLSATREKAVLESAKSKYFTLLAQAAAEAENCVRDSLEQFDNPAFAAVTCTPEYFLSRSEIIFKNLSKLKVGYQKFSDDHSDIEELLQSVNTFAHLSAVSLLQGKAISNLPSVVQSEDLINSCRSAGMHCLDLFSTLKNPEIEDFDNHISKVNQEMTQMVHLIETLIIKEITTENIGAMLENELRSMDQTIDEAAAHIEALLSKSREEDTGIKLEVNERILDSCTTLMKAIKILVMKSRDLQQEVVAQGKGTSSDKDFYMKNHRWTEGLLSAAKAVGLGATVLVEVADKLVRGKCKFEELIVASQEIAASTAQLVVASKVKADRYSENLTALSESSKNVSRATGSVVASAKCCSQMVEEKASLDFSNLSLHKIKRMEMDSQVRVLELESGLSRERTRLAELRKQHYTMAGASEGWDEEDLPK